MLDEIVMDVVLQSHQEIARSKTICPRCHKRYASRVLFSVQMVSLNRGGFGSVGLVVVQVNIYLCLSWFRVVRSKGVI